MSEVEQTNTNPEPETTPETREQVWEKTVTSKVPITAEEVRGDSGPKPEVASDRTLVAPELEKFINSNKEPEVDPLSERLARIEALLHPEETGEPLSQEDRILAELRELKAEKEEYLREQRQRETEEAHQARLRTLKEGVVTNLRADPEKYPGLIALEQEENVFHTLVNKLQEGQSISEDDIASEAEANLRQLRDKLNEVYGQSSSNEKTTSEPKPQTTLTQNLTAGDEPFNLQDLIKAKGTKEAQSALWDKVHNR